MGADYTQEEIRGAIDTALPQTSQPDRSSGVFPNEAELEKIKASVVDTLVTDPDSVLYLVQLASGLTITKIDELVENLDKLTDILSRTKYKKRASLDSDSVSEAEAHLRSLSTETSTSAMARRLTLVDTSLEKVATGLVGKDSSPHISESAKDMAIPFGRVLVLFPEVVDLQGQITEIHTEATSTSLVSKSLNSQASRGGQILSDVKANSLVAPDATARASALRLLAVKSLLSKKAKVKDPLEPKVTDTFTATGKSTKAKITGTKSAPFNLVPGVTDALGLAANDTANATWDTPESTRPVLKSPEQPPFTASLGATALVESGAGPFTIIRTSASMEVRTENKRVVSCTTDVQAAGVLPGDVIDNTTMGKARVLGVAGFTLFVDADLTVGSATKEIYKDNRLQVEVNGQGLQIVEYPVKDIATTITAANIVSNMPKLPGALYSENVGALKIETRVDIDSSSIGNPTTITTDWDHALDTGDKVLVTGHVGSTPSLQGIHTVTKITDDTFTIPVNVTVGGTGGEFYFRSGSAHLAVHNNGFAKALATWGPLSSDGNDGNNQVNLTVNETTVNADITGVNLTAASVAALLNSASALLDCAAVSGNLEVRTADYGDDQYIKILAGDANTDLGLVEGIEQRGTDVSIPQIRDSAPTGVSVDNDYTHFVGPISLPISSDTIDFGSTPPAGLAYGDRVEIELSGGRRAYHVNTVIMQDITLQESIADGTYTVTIFRDLLTLESTDETTASALKISTSSPATSTATATALGLSTTEARGKVSTIKASTKDLSDLDGSPVRKKDTVSATSPVSSVTSLEGTDTIVLDAEITNNFSASGDIDALGEKTYQTLIDGIASWRAEYASGTFAQGLEKAFSRKVREAISGPASGLALSAIADLKTLATSLKSYLAVYSANSVESVDSALVAMKSRKLNRARDLLEAGKLDDLLSLVSAQASYQGKALHSVASAATEFKYPSGFDPDDYIMEPKTGFETTPSDFSDRNQEPENARPADHDIDFEEIY